MPMPDDLPLVPDCGLHL